jgi:hypothetical protein
MNGIDFDRNARVAANAQSAPLSMDAVEFDAFRHAAMQQPA